MSETSSVRVLSRSDDAEIIAVLDCMIGESLSHELGKVMKTVRNEVAARTSFVIELKASLVGEERRVTVYEVVWTNDSGTWYEAFGSREHLVAFLTGLKACCGMFQMYMPDIEIPRASD